MATIYNKTALNKIKKADLIALFLEQQAEKNQLVLESEEHQKVKSHMIYMGHDKMKADLKKLKEENKKLKNRIEEDHKAVPSFLIQDMYRDVKEENKKLKEQLDEQYSFSYFKQVKELTAETEKLKQQNDYAYKQINELMSKVTLLTDEIEKLKEESDSESDEECDQCVCCEVEFDQHEARYNMGEDLRLKYQKYFGSEKDDGDICPECLNRISD